MTKKTRKTTKKTAKTNNNETFVRDTNLAFASKR